MRCPRFDAGECSSQRLVASVKTVCIALAFCGISIFGFSANASPCDGIDDRPISAERKAVLTPVIADQLNSKNVKILRLFSADDWNIIYVETPDSDPPFVFFKGSPIDSRYITLWSGGATIFDEQNINEWVLKNAPGIPRHLAACFAWYVTPPHRDQ